MARVDGRRGRVRSGDRDGFSALWSLARLSETKLGWRHRRVPAGDQGSGVAVEDLVEADGVGVDVGDVDDGRDRSAQRAGSVTEAAGCVFGGRDDQRRVAVGAVELPECVHEQGPSGRSAGHQPVSVACHRPARTVKGMTITPETSITDVVYASIDAYTDNAESYAIANQDRMSGEVARFLNGLEPADDIILDAGCGPGRDLVRFAAAGHCVVGVDLNETFVAAALDAVSDLPVHVQIADLRDLPFDDATFAAVWSCASLVHLPPDDARVALAELARVTEPGGRLYVSVKIAGDTGWTDTPQGWRWFHIWDRHTFLDTVEDAGFELSSAKDSGVFVDVYATKP